MKNILVAYDGGESAHRALRTGIDLAKRFDASLSLISVVPTHPGRARFDPWDDKPVHDRELAEVREIAAKHGVDAEVIEPTGSPAQAIEKIAEIGRFDTVIVGSNRRNVALRFLAGSVSQHLATHANATVIVAR